MLTIHLLVQNNEKTIYQALKSVVVLNASILVGNLGSKDNTINICKEFNTDIFDVSPNDLSVARNTLISKTKTPWAFYLHPWEVLVGGHYQLLESIKLNKNSYLCQVFQGNIITKEIRLWNVSSLKFDNPVYETIYDPMAFFEKDIILYNTGTNVNYDEQFEIIKEWKKKQPISSNPYYYEACVLLQQGNYKEFISIANYYLFREQSGLSTIMLKYYLAMVYLKYKNYRTALFHLLACVAIRPLMAEFWCLLGDIFYKQDKFIEAKMFYDNAIILGSRRILSDDWPIDINKYKEYPEKMAESCNKMIYETRYYFTDSEKLI